MSDPEWKYAIKYQPLTLISAYVIFPIGIGILFVLYLARPTISQFHKGLLTVLAFSFLLFPFIAYFAEKHYKVGRRFQILARYGLIIFYAGAAIFCAGDILFGNHPDPASKAYSYYTFLGLVPIIIFAIKIRNQ